jgi:hypothetical protein
MKNLDYDEPPWERVWNTTNLSTAELQLLVFELLNLLDLEAYVKRYGNSTGRDPEFFLEKYNQGN